ncbi:MAG: hypothetical protein K5663_11270 [Clostridiales bacterium]|nr:hypothetical protein [Clostridiales bacterium]
MTDGSALIAERSLTGAREWLYGACSACIKKRAKANGWRPKTKGELGWFWTDNAPRLKEYGDPKDMDDEGVLRLMEAAFGGRQHYASGTEPEPPEPVIQPKPVEPKKRKPEIPDGMKKCRGCDALLPVGGPTHCPKCARAKAAVVAALRHKRLSEHCCTQCGVPLPEGAASSRCEGCRVHNRKYWENYKGARA